MQDLFCPDDNQQQAALQSFAVRHVPVQHAAPESLDVALYLPAGSVIMQVGFTWVLSV